MQLWQCDLPLRVTKRGRLLWNCKHEAYHYEKWGFKVFKWSSLKDKSEISRKQLCASKLFLKTIIFFFQLSYHMLIETLRLLLVKLKFRIVTYTNQTWDHLNGTMPRHPKVTRIVNAKLNPFLNLVRNVNQTQPKNGKEVDMRFMRSGLSWLGRCS